MYWPEIAAFENRLSGIDGGASELLPAQAIIVSLFGLTSALAVLPVVEHGRRLAVAHLSGARLGVAEYRITALNIISGQLFRSPLLSITIPRGVASRTLTVFVLPSAELCPINKAFR